MAGVQRGILTIAAAVQRRFHRQRREFFKTRYCCQTRVIWGRRTKRSTDPPFGRPWPWRAILAVTATLGTRFHAPPSHPETGVFRRV